MKRMGSKTYMLLLLFALGCGATDPGLRREIRALETQIGVLESRIQTVEDRSGISARPQTQVRQSRQEGGNASVEAPASVETAETPAQDSQQGETFSELPSVSEVQQALKQAGFYQGEVDGKTGPMTKGAIREFQRVNGLEVDGVMGAETWKLLKPHLGNS